MSTIENRIKETFDAITLPSDVKRATLQAIEDEATKKDKGQVVLSQASSVESPGDTMGHPQSFSESSSVPSKGFSPKVVSKSAKRRSSLSMKKRLGFALAACLVMAAFGVGGFSAYATEAAVVGIEVNPSIELGVNRFDVVINARALNDDGQNVLDTVSVIGKSYDEAFTVITSSSTFLSYIKDDSFVDINVVCDDERQANTLVNQSDGKLGTLPCEGACNQVASTVRQEALAEGMGVGRYEMASSLRALDSTVTLEECRAMSTKELRIRIAEIDPTNEYAYRPYQGQGNQGQDPQAQGNQGQGNQNQGGQGQGNQGQGSQGQDQPSQGTGQGQGYGQQGQQGQGLGQGNQGQGSQGTGQGNQGAGQGQNYQGQNAGTDSTPGSPQGGRRSGRSS